MTGIQSWFLGYLVTAAWQAMVICGGAWLLARAMRRLGPAVEHRVWVAALAAQVVLPGLEVRPVRLSGPVADAGQGMVTVVTGDGLVHGWLQPPLWLLAILAGMYAAVILFYTARLAWGLWQTAQLGRRAVPLGLSPAAAAVWRECRSRFWMGEAKIRVSTMVAGPVTVGIWRRLLLLPPEFAQSVSAEEFAAAIAHECAHIERRDFAKNLIYQVARLPLAWHPAVSFALGRITQTREMVCDELAAHSTAGTQVYAHALLRLAASNPMPMRQRNLHAIGIFDANCFEERVMRLVEAKQQVKGVRRALMLGACVAAGLGTCAVAAEMKVSVAVPVAGQSEAAAKSTARVSGGVMAGNILTKVAPVYPQEAKDAKVQGTVVLHAIIGKDGAIESLHVVSGPPELVPSAMDAVKQWVYKPYMLNGEPTEVDTTITVNYHLGN